MEILKRPDQQANTIRELVEELRCERSYRGIERLVQLTLQALLDLGIMVLSAMGSSPSGYRDVANLLGRHGLLENNDAELMRAMAGLRGVLVHAYVGTNRKIVVESLNPISGGPSSHSVFRKKDVSYFALDVRACQACTIK